jgi:predicted adenylyl cyclase CyaB
MPANVEFKARLRNAAAAHAIAARLSGAGGEPIPQTDIFFEASSGRLKLRILGPARAEWISYQRTDSAAPRRSDYRIAPAANPAELIQVLAPALTVTGVVKKERRLYRYGQARIHIDRVDGLGDFLEIEVVLRPEQPEAEGHAMANDLLRRFGVAPDDLLGCAYVDLMREAGVALDWRTAVEQTLSPSHAGVSVQTSPARL